MASETSPKIAAAKANLTAEPLLAKDAYNLTLSSSRMQPSQKGTASKKTVNPGPT